MTSSPLSAGRKRHVRTRNPRRGVSTLLGDVDIDPPRLRRGPEWTQVFVIHGEIDQTSRLPIHLMSPRLERQSPFNDHPAPRLDRDGLAAKGRPRPGAGKKTVQRRRSRRRSVERRHRQQFRTPSHGVRGFPA